MCYNTRPWRLGGAVQVGCAAACSRLHCVSKQLSDIALRGPRDFGFAAWVIKTAKAPVPASIQLSRDLSFWPPPPGHPWVRRSGPPGSR
jgi:hypothetical protein